jgi:hypothetical protein
MARRKKLKNKPGESAPLYFDHPAVTCSYCGTYQRAGNVRVHCANLVDLLSMLSVVDYHYHDDDRFIVITVHASGSIEA